MDSEDLKGMFDPFQGVWLMLSIGCKINFTNADSCPGANGVRMVAYPPSGKVSPIRSMGKMPPEVNRILAFGLATRKQKARFKPLWNPPCPMFVISRSMSRLIPDSISNAWTLLLALTT